MALRRRNSTTDYFPWHRFEASLRSESREREILQRERERGELGAKLTPLGKRGAEKIKLFEE